MLLFLLNIMHACLSEDPTCIGQACEKVASDLVIELCYGSSVFFITYKWPITNSSTNSWLGVGLVISRSLVQLPAGALWSVFGQDSLFHIASVYPAAKWVPSMNKAVLRACALYAASCSGMSPRGLKWFPCVQAC